MLQETKLYLKNQIKLKGYQIYESVRNKKGSGGGLLTAVHEGLDAVLISEGNEAADILIVKYL